MIRCETSETRGERYFVWGCFVVCVIWLLRILREGRGRGGGDRREGEVGRERGKARKQEQEKNLPE